MNLTIYAVPVGKVDRKNISIVSEINATTADDEEVSNYDNPRYGDTDAREENNSEDILTVFDVLLAGVSHNE